MASLRYSLILLGLLFPAYSYGLAEPFDPALIKRGAWESLVRCQRSHSVYWAKLLSQIDSQAAYLYRIAWLQVSFHSSAKPTYQTLQIAETQSSWIWRWNGEIWADEIELWGKDKETCLSQVGQQAVRYLDLPAPLVHELIMSRLDVVSSLSASTREILKGYLSHLWSIGTKVEMNQNPFPSSWSKEDQCEWRILRTIHSKNTEIKPLQELLKECSLKIQGGKSFIWAEAQILLGDLLLNEALPQQAFESYRSAMEHLSRTTLPSSFQYRVAVSALLSQSSDDSTLRSVSKLLGQNEESISENPSSSKLDKTYEKILENLLCHRLEEMKPRDVVNLMTRVFQKKSISTQAYLLTSQCSGPRVNEIWRAVLDQTSNTRERAKLLGILLSHAVNQSSISRARSYARMLAKISKNLPFAASHEFWHGIATGMPSRFREIVDLYHREAQWQALDDDKFRRWMKKNEKQSSEERSDSTIPFNIDHGRAGEPLKLASVFSSLPPLTLNLDIRANFIQLFFQYIQNSHRDSLQ